MTVCQDCNIQIDNGSGRRKRCIQCAEKRQKQQMAKWRQDNPDI